MKRLAIIVALLPAAVSAQMDGHAHGDYVMGMNLGTATEGGQGAFAALAEIVSLLSADPDTDWSKVDIGALRRHLQDMDQLAMTVDAVEKPIPGGLKITILRDSPGAKAAWRMVPAHTPVLTAETGWKSDVAVQEDRIIWTVTSDSAEAQVRGLGFFGLMATGNHHPAHHLAIARGAAPH
ncbi:hypothetical protein [Antarctobacter heliothermus]|uniref:Uncharacterized protein n=1 Tax=Antarctobacter heliothermus TaxID=74033 RepID=A0A239BHA0_9RHOB|nr:hypothetical protein [Antarctobacter heliothermus]SNS06748.1 hypothetical protein SAMN04488078_100394 [Antarctobacter heliothermus]